MKNISSIIILLFCSFQLLGQNILFEYSHKSPSGVSFYKAHVNNNYSEQSYIAEKQIHNNTIIDDKSTPTNIFFIKSKKDNYLYKTDGFSEQYYLKDSLHPMKWKFGKEKKTILGFLCKSATTTFRGRNYTAFYTENISVPDGPWKFGVLPGLILAVISEDKEYEWNVEKIIQNYKENINEMQIENLLKNNKFLTWKEHTLKYKEAIDKEVARLKAKKGSSMFNSYFKIDAVEIIYPQAQTGSGLEF